MNHSTQPPNAFNLQASFHRSFNYSARLHGSPVSRCWGGSGQLGCNMQASCRTRQEQKSMWILYAVGCTLIIVVGARAGVASCMAGTEVQATARTAVISLGRRTLLSEFVRELLRPCCLRSACAIDILGSCQSGRQLAHSPLHRRPEFCAPRLGPPRVAKE